MGRCGYVNFPLTGNTPFRKHSIHLDLDTLSADVTFFRVTWNEGIGYRPGT
jgi:hypothetical protein